MTTLLSDAVVLSQLGGKVAVLEKAVGETLDWLIDATGGETGRAFTHDEKASFGALITAERIFKTLRHLSEAWEASE